MPFLNHHLQCHLEKTAQKFGNTFYWKIKANQHTSANIVQLNLNSIHQLQEIAVLESTGNRPSSLEKIYNAMLSLPPSSIEAERSFSAAGLFVTNLRTSLNDDTVDNLCFLRSYLIKREIKS